jgi:hypothetical protein
MKCSRKGAKSQIRKRLGLSGYFRSQVRFIVHILSFNLHSLRLICILTIHIDSSDTLIYKLPPRHSKHEESLSSAPGGAVLDFINL